VGSLAGFRLFGVIIAAVIAGFVWQDANKRGMSGPLWGIGTFFLCIIFLPLYLIMRKPLLIAGQVPPGTQVYMPPPGQYPPPPPGQYPPPSQGQYPAPPPPSTFPAPPAGSASGPSAGPVHFCTQCGQKYEGTVKFCPNCGAAV
jgi:hypothetical protein